MGCVADEFPVRIFAGMNDDERIGFQRLPPEELKKISEAGGRAAHKSGKAHKWTTETARKAGRRGGELRRQRRAAEEGNGKASNT